MTSPEYNANEVWGDLGEMDNQYEDIPAMDHSMHHGHSMKMNFHGDHSGIIFLFESWSIDSTTHLFWYSVLTLLMGILIEYIKDYRFRHTNAKLNATSKNYKSLHLKDSVLHLIQTTVGYFLMLIAMTFHYALFSAAMLGMAIGYWIFNRVEKPEPGSENSNLMGCKGHMIEKGIAQDSCGC